MLRLARWHAPDTCACIPPSTASCRPVACSAPYFRTPSTRPSTHPAPSDLALYLSMARSPLLKTHSLRPARRTRQRLTSHDFIESARRPIPAFVPGASRRALPIKIWRESPGIGKRRATSPGGSMEFRRSHCDGGVGTLNFGWGQNRSRSENAASTAMIKCGGHENPTPAVPAEPKAGDCR